MCQTLFQRGFTCHSQGDHPCVVSDGPTKRPQHMRISRLITVTYLRTRCEQIAHCLPMISQAFAGCQVVRVVHECSKPYLLLTQHSFCSSSVTDYVLPSAIWIPLSICQVCVFAIWYKSKQCQMFFCAENRQPLGPMGVDTCCLWQAAEKLHRSVDLLSG